MVNMKNKYLHIYVWFLLSLVSSSLSLGLQEINNSQRKCLSSIIPRLSQVTSFKLQNYLLVRNLSETSEDSKKDFIKSNLQRNTIAMLDKSQKLDKMSTRIKSKIENSFKGSKCKNLIEKSWKLKIN